MRRIQRYQLGFWLCTRKTKILSLHCVSTETTLWESTSDHADNFPRVTPVPSQITWPADSNTKTVHASLNCGWGIIQNFTLYVYVQGLNFGYSLSIFSSFIFFSFSSFSLSPFLSCLCCFFFPINFSRGVPLLFPSKKMYKIWSLYRFLED